jgi:hypothetical protein
MRRQMGGETARIAQGARSLHAKVGRERACRSQNYPVFVSHSKST